jgi:hypothetical protein
MATRRKPNEYDWSNLEFDARPLPNLSKRSSTRREKIQFVVIHHMTIVGKGDGSANTACINTWGNREASAHYGVDGVNVAQFVWDNLAAWATANQHGNHAGISIEHANSKAAPSWTVSDDTWKTGAKLVAHLCLAYKLGRPKAGKNLFRHADFFATSCAGPYLGSKIYKAYEAEAQRVYDLLVKGETVKPPVVVKPTPAPAPAPVEKHVKITSSSLNAAGSNATGAKTGKARAKKYISALKSKPVHIVNVQEATVASDFRPTLDTGLKPLGYSRAGGGDGRYCYARGVKVIDSGVFTAPASSEFNGDDKQAAWVAYELDGAKGMDVSIHLENEDGADSERVEQALYFAKTALAKAKALSVPSKNVLIVGDTNSEGMVLEALVKAGWRNVAAGTKYENVHTYMGWDGRARKRFDYAFVRKDAASAELLGINHSTDVSDHAALRVSRQLTK